MADNAAVESVTTGQVVGDIEAALADLDAILRIIPVPALWKFEPALRATLAGVHTIAQVTGLEPAAGAQQKFISHVTPGQPGAPELS